MLYHPVNDRNCDPGHSGSIGSFPYTHVFFHSDYLNGHNELLVFIISLLIFFPYGT